MPDFNLAAPALPLITERLVLRRFLATDLPDFHAYQCLDEVVRYLYRHPYTLEESRASLTRIVQEPFSEDGNRLTLAVERRLSAGVVGQVTLRLAHRAAEQGEIGYIFNPAAQGKGFATEATVALVELAFQHFGFHRLYARLDAENRASLSLLRRLGFRQEAHLRENDYFDGRWGDELILAMLAEEWRLKRLSARSRP